jgi:plasmid stabilization system protein ParE
VRVRLSLDARNQLAGAVAHVRAQNVPAARSIRRRVHAATVRLSRFPHLGVIVSEPRDQVVVRELLVDPYAVRYVVTDVAIVVIGLRHQRQLAEKDADQPSTP